MGVLGVSGAILAVAAAANASETVTYSYDTLGRLVTSVRSGGPNTGIILATCFDQAGNRMRQDIASGVPSTCPTPAPTPSPSP